MSDYNKLIKDLSDILHSKSQELEMRKSQLNHGYKNIQNLIDVNQFEYDTIQAASVYIVQDQTARIEKEAQFKKAMSNPIDV